MRPRTLTGVNRAWDPAPWGRAGGRATLIAWVRLGMGMGDRVRCDIGVHEVGVGWLRVSRGAGFGSVGCGKRWVRRWLRWCWAHAYSPTTRDGLIARESSTAIVLVSVSHSVCCHAMPCHKTPDYWISAPTDKNKNKTKTRMINAAYAHPRARSGRSHASTILGKKKNHQSTSDEPPTKILATPIPPKLPAR